MAITLNAPSQVRPYATFSSFPATGSLKTIYIAEDTNKIYRWTGSAYVELSETDATTWGSITGTLSAQTDLQTAIDAKFDEPTGNSTQYLDGTGAPTTFPTALPPSGTAGGDLTGTYPNPTVHRIHGIDLQNGTPSAGDVWVYGGSPAKWQHQHLNASQVDNDSSVTGTSVELALEHLDSTKVPTTRTLTINGTTQDLSADRTFTISTGITIGTTAITSGTVGRILFEGTGNVVQESANLFWDNTNNIFNVTGLIKATLNNVYATHTGANAKGMFIVNNADSVIRAGLQFDGNTAYVELLGRYNNGAAFLRQDGSNGNISFLRSGSEYLRIFGATGNVLINTTTDAGFKLDVNGTARVSDNLLLTNGIIATSTATTRLQGSTNYFTHNRLGSSGALGFQISQTGTISSFWRWSDATDAVEFGNARNAPVALFTNNTEKMRIVGNGSVLINTTTDVASSKLTIESTTQGVLFPRMTTTQKNAIATPATGLVVFDSTLNKLCVRGASAWETITSL